MKTGKRILSVFLLFFLLFALHSVWAGGKKEEVGGILKVGTQPVNNLDPHFATTIADILLLEQVFDHLTYIDENNRPVPDLATSWDSPDGKTWTFDLREGVKFSNGADLTAEDVVFTFNRLRDPDVGTPVAALYKNISEVKAVGSNKVQFVLAEPNPEFPADVGDYHACIIPKDSKDPATERIGSGAFTIAEYYPEDRAILKKNPNYWAKDDDAQSLPYLDELHLIFSPDIGGQVEALRGGELHFVGGLSAQYADVVKSDANTKLVTNDSNMHWVLHMRSDAGHVASDNRVRKALKLGTDQQALIDAIHPGLAAPGNGFTPVGPAYGDYHLNKPHRRDVARAKQLLAEAGFADGLKITLHAQNQLDVPAIATIWKEQMAEIGVEVNIEVIPSDVYFGDSDKSWLKTDFGITDWGSRATPVTYFKLAYISEGPWNESHWSDPEFDTLTARIDSEMDKAKRVELYKKAQEIMIDRGPIIVAYFEKAIAGIAAGVEGITLAADWARTRFVKARFAK